VRDTNEDRGRHISPADDDVLANRGRLTIVADGMGGHSSGEVAAHMAVEVVNERYYSNSDDTPQNALCRAIQEANHQIFAASLRDARFSGMGTTLVALVLIDDMAFSAHVGDSRLYRLRENALELLTTDHSQVMQMVREGVISIDEAREHEDRNVILRAVGTQPEVEIEISEQFGVRPYDIFLLCSDGLHDMISDDSIKIILASEVDEHLICDRLIDSAKEQGGHDNVTVGVVKICARPSNAKPRVRITREVEALSPIA
jgi:protein phosphatase